MTPYRKALSTAHLTSARRTAFGASRNMRMPNSRREFQVSCFSLFGRPGQPARKPLQKAVGSWKKAWKKPSSTVASCCMRKSPPKTAKSRCRWFSGVQSAEYASAETFAGASPAAMPAAMASATGVAAAKARQSW